MSLNVFQVHPIFAGSSLAHWVCTIDLVDAICPMVVPV